MDFEGKHLVASQANNMCALLRCRAAGATPVRTMVPNAVLGLSGAHQAVAGGQQSTAVLLCPCILVLDSVSPAEIKPCGKVGRPARRPCLAVTGLQLHVPRPGRPSLALCGGRESFKQQILRFIPEVRVAVQVHLPRYFTGATHRLQACSP